MSLRLLPSYSSCIMLVWVLGPEESDGEEEGKEDRDKDHVHVEVSRSASQSASQSGWLWAEPKKSRLPGGQFWVCTSAVRSLVPSSAWGTKYQECQIDDQTSEDDIQ